MAMTFFNAPPSSAPTVSVVRYIRSAGVASSACNAAPVSSSAQASVSAVGILRAMSAAKLGPVRIAPVASATVALIVATGPVSVVRSIPLQQAMMILPDRAAA